MKLLKGKYEQTASQTKEQAQKLAKNRRLKFLARDKDYEEIKEAWEINVLKQKELEDSMRSLQGIMDRNEVINMTTNSGFACIVIRKRCLARILQENDIFEIAELKKYRTKHHNLKSFAPKAESEIIWSTFLNPNKYAFIKRWGFWLLLNVIFIYLLTPTVFNNWLESHRTHEQGSLFDVFLSFFQTLTAIIINVGIIPPLVDLSINFSDYETKVEREIQSMNMLYFFMGMNTMSLSGTPAATTNFLIKNLRTIAPNKLVKVLTSKIMS